jgi:hypothetical protein
VVNCVDGCDAAPGPGWLVLAADLAGSDGAWIDDGDVDGEQALIIRAAVAAITGRLPQGRGIATA